MFQEAGQTGRKSENPSLQRRLDAITSSLNYIGGTIGTVVEVSFLLFMHPYMAHYRRHILVLFFSLGYASSHISCVYRGICILVCIGASSALY